MKKLTLLIVFFLISPLIFAIPNGKYIIMNYYIQTVNDGVFSSLQSNGNTVIKAFSIYDHEQYSEPILKQGELQLLNNEDVFDKYQVLWIDHANCIQTIIPERNDLKVTIHFIHLENNQYWYSYSFEFDLNSFEILSNDTGDTNFMIFSGVTVKALD